MIETILVDADGVLMDFMGRVAAVWKRDYAGLMKIWPKGEWSAARVLGITDRQFWRRIDTEKFWSGVRPYPGAAAFLRTLSGRLPTVICTSATRSAAALTAKLRGLRALCGEDQPIVVMQNASKRLLAGPTALLIDDCDRVVDEYRLAGGRAVLFPRRWNRDGYDAKFATVLGMVNTMLAMR